MNPPYDSAITLSTTTHHATNTSSSNPPSIFKSKKLDYRVSRVAILCKDCGHDCGFYPAQHQCQKNKEPLMRTPTSPNTTHHPLHTSTHASSPTSSLKNTTERSSSSTSSWTQWWQNFANNHKQNETEATSLASPMKSIEATSLNTEMSEKSQESSASLNEWNPSTKLTGFWNKLKTSVQVKSKLQHDSVNELQETKPESKGFF
ncbi:hypothetical protein HMI54_011208 [Coelomomyces lativittatus]|nr:hypothetical protein HMI54_011208 [Coelomomyces lativittatus]